MAKKITLCGKELTLAYSLHAAVSYEKMTGKSALDLSQFQNNQLSPVVELGYCMLLGCNPENDVPKLEDLLRDLDTVEKMTEFVQAVSAELIAFYQPDTTTRSYSRSSMIRATRAATRLYGVERSQTVSRSLSIV